MSLILCKRGGCYYGYIVYIPTEPCPVTVVTSLKCGTPPILNIPHPRGIIIVVENSGTDTTEFFFYLHLFPVCFWSQRMALFRNMRRNSSRNLFGGEVWRDGRKNPGYSSVCIISRFRTPKLSHHTLEMFHHCFDQILDLNT